MKVLVIGKGGREHAIAHAASRSKKVTKVFVAPGNVGMCDIATCVQVSDQDVAGLVAFAKQEQIDLTIVGPEASLSLGVVDAFQEAGLKIFGPSKAATQLEASKDFTKRLMAKYHVPTAAYATFAHYEEAAAYVKKQGVPIVIKEDGLKAGKGVTVAMTMEDALEALDIAFALPQNKVVIEEYLEGFEFSLLCFACGTTLIPMEIAQDHKRAYDNDAGPNTIMYPVAEAMVKEGCPFTGFLYGGLMLTKEGVKVIEFNARFGDPEAEVILPRLESDFIEVIEAVMEQREMELQWDPQVTLGVVLAIRHHPPKALWSKAVKKWKNCFITWERMRKMGSSLLPEAVY